MELARTFFVMRVGFDLWWSSVMGPGASSFFLSICTTVSSCPAFSVDTLRFFDTVFVFAGFFVFFSLDASTARSFSSSRLFASSAALFSSSIFARRELVRGMVLRSVEAGDAGLPVAFGSIKQAQTRGQAAVDVCLHAQGVEVNLLSSTLRKTSGASTSDTTRLMYFASAIMFLATAVRSCRAFVPRAGLTMAPVRAPVRMFSGIEMRGTRRQRFARFGGRGAAPPAPGSSKIQRGQRRDARDAAGPTRRSSARSSGARRRPVPT